jgi:hypothetical protein
MLTEKSLLKRSEMIPQMDNHKLDYIYVTPRDSKMAARGRKQKASLL